MYKDHLAGSENFFLQGPKKYFLSIPFIVGVGEKKKKKKLVAFVEIIFGRNIIPTKHYFCNMIES